MTCLTGNEIAAIMVGAELGMTPDESLRRIAVVKPTVTLSRAGRRAIEKAQQRAHLLRVARVLRRPNLAAAPK